MLQQHVLPAYECLGSLTLVYLLGSLVSGYTQDADLDMMMVWDELDVPAGALRELLVARFEERPNASPCVVDYRDIHLERIVLAGQEYNVARLPLASFEAIIRSVLLVALLIPRAVAVLRHAERGASSAEKPEITAKPTKGWGGLSKHLRALLAASIIAGTAPLSGFSAIALGLLGYVTALFELSAVFTIVWASLLLDEGNMRQRLLGASVMILDGIVIAP
jgi:hypothetical protein